MTVAKKKDRKTMVLIIVYVFTKSYVTKCIHNGNIKQLWNIIINIKIMTYLIYSNIPSSIIFMNEINSLYISSGVVSGGEYNVCAIQKWRNRTDIENAIKQYIKCNGEYQINGSTFINNIPINLRQIIEKFKINRNHRI